MAVLLLTILVSITLVSLTYHYLVLDGRWAMSSAWLGNANVEARSAALGQLGDYFGGTLNPILSFSGFLVLLLTVVIQRRQLLEGTRQLEQSTRAIDLEAFAYPALRALAGDAGALAWAKRQNSELRVTVGGGQLNLSAQ